MCPSGGTAKGLYEARFSHDKKKKKKESGCFVTIVLYLPLICYFEILAGGD